MKGCDNVTQNSKVVYLNPPVYIRFRSGVREKEQTIKRKLEGINC